MPSTAQNPSPLSPRASWRAMIERHSTVRHTLLRVDTSSMPISCSRHRQWEQLQRAAGTTPRNGRLPRKWVSPFLPYVGCALQLFGDAGAVHLIKLHLQSGKVTFLVYDDFEGTATSRLIERIKVDLPRLPVDFFYYVDEYAPQPLVEDRAEFYLSQTLSEGD